MAERRIINGWIVEKGDDGQIRTIGPANQAPQMPTNPTFPYEGPKAQADLQSRQIGNQVDAATAPYAAPKAAADVQKAQADAELARMKLKEAQDAAGKKGGKAASDALLGVISQIDNIANDVQDNGGWGETGFTGARLRGWEGSAAYDIAQKLKTIDANLAFNELQKMRDNSPTGGALGQVTEKELDLLRSTVANLDPNQSQEEFLRSLKRARDSYTSMLERADPELAARVQAAYEKQNKDPLVGYVSSNGSDWYGPDGSAPRPSGGSGGVPGASQRDTTMGAIDAFGRRFANAPTLGMADKFAAGMNALVPLDNLFGANNRSVWDGSSLNDAYNANLALQQRTGAADQQVNPYASTAGDVAGSIVGMMGANAGLKALGAGGLVARTGGAAGDVLYGATRGGVENGPAGALVGGGAALGGNLAGKYLLAPVARRIADTGVGQAAINTARRGTNALGNAGRGLFGKAPVPYTPATIPAALSGGERAAAARIPEDVQAQLGQAEQMGIPMGLVDTSPQLQSLGGSVARKSPDALAMARQMLGQRALGQADRAQQQIAQNFGPIANPNEISNQLLQQARANSAPLYDAFRAQPARTSDELQAILQTPAGNQALRNARSIAANEGRDPNALGFDLDQQGNVVLRSDPSPETLDLVKRGLDDVINGYKNPMTGQLDLNDQGRAIEGLRQRFVSEADRLYPNYADARAAYAGPAAERQALQMGRDMTNKAPRDIQDAMGRMTPGQVEQFRLGQRVGMSDAVDKVRYSSNPYQNIYGSPVAQQRSATVFGEGPAQRMRDAYDLEQRMAQTGYDVLGGSPTAMRAAADEAFDNPMATGIDVGFSALTGGGGAKELGAKLVQKLGDTYRLGASKKRADQLAPILFNTNPAEARKIIEALSKKSAARDVYVKRTRKAGGLFGAGVGSALIPLSQ